MKKNNPDFLWGDVQDPKCGYMQFWRLIRGGGGGVLTEADPVNYFGIVISKKKKK